MKSVPLKLCCNITCMAEQDGLLELWLMCHNIFDFLKSLSELAGISTVLATGSINGRVFKPFPTKLDDLVVQNTHSTIFAPGSTIMIHHCGNNRAKLIELLLPYSKRVRLKKNSNVVQATLYKQVSIEYLFDNGIRVLKPFITPPILLKRPQKRSI